MRWELAGREDVPSSNAPAIGGRSRDPGRLVNFRGRLLSSIERVRETVARDKLAGSPVAGFLCLLKVRQTDGRSSLLSCRRRVPRPNFRLNDEVFDVTEPVCDFSPRIAKLIDS